MTAFQAIPRPTARCFRRAPVLAAIAALGLGTAVGTAQASCGAAFCTLLNDRFALGTADHVGWSTDLRLESLTQKRLRSGTQTLNRDDVDGVEELGIRTRNTVLRATVDYAFDPAWSVSLRAPFLDVNHLRDVFDEEAGAPAGRVSHRYRRLGDLQVLGRWQPAAGTTADADRRWALSAGLKLPTGSFTVTNDEGERADRALQPGSGTTDLLLGAAVRQVLGMADALNLQAQVALPLNTREDFKPGRRAEVSAGWSHALTPAWTAVLQLNAAWRGPDAGLQAESEDSGSTALMLSPGLALALAGDATVYVTLQAPLYQRVKGIQLVAPYAVALGWTQTF